MNSQDTTPQQSSLPETLASVLEEEFRSLQKLPARVTLIDGVRRESLAGFTMYRFEIPENLYLSYYVEQVSVQLGRVKPLLFTAIVCSIENQYLTLAFPFDLGSTVTEIECTWSYEATLKAIQDSLRTKSPSGVSLSLLFNPSDPANRYPSQEPPGIPPDTPEEQSNAIRKIFGNRVTLLWGPIRSGKTRILAAVAAHYVKNGKTVLFVAGSNDRIDDVLLESLEAGERLGADLTASTARVGLPVPHRVNDVRAISFDHQIHQVRREKQSALGDEHELYSKAHAMKVKYAVHDEYFARLSQMKGLVDGNKRQIDRLTAEVTALKESIARIQHASVVNRFKKGFGKEDLQAAQKQLTEKSGQLKRAQSKHTVLSASLVKFEAGSPVDTDEWTEYQKLIKQIDDEKGLQSLDRTIAEQTAEAEETILRTKKFIGTTAIGALTHGKVKEQNADLVIIDDAESLPVPLIAALAHKARERLVVAGDPFQAGPASMSVSANARAWIQTDIFQRVAGTEVLPTLFDWAHKNSEWSVLIASHYASTVKLSRFVGSVLFDEKIKVTVPSTARGHVYVVDTSGLGGENVQYVGKRRILPFNQVHADKVIDLIKHAILATGAALNEIGVITPFQGHTLYLKRQIRIHGLEGIEVGTPHSFRGRRKRVIIADTAVGGIDYTLKQVDDVKIGEHELVRMLNTIFSCVAEDLYLVADMKHVQSVYKGRLLSKILLILQSQADELPKTGENVKRFNRLHWDERAALLTDAQSARREAVASRLRDKPIDDLELEIRLKMREKQRQGAEMAGPRDLAQETYLEVLKTIGMFKDLNYLCQFTGGGILFHRTPAALEAIARLPREFCSDEAQFRKVTDAWNLLIYELSGGSNTTNPYFIRTAPEAQARWDVNSLKALYSPDVETALEEGKHKIAASATKIFQETLGKSQPENQTDWTDVYLAFLSKLQLYFRWISDELRK